MGLAVAPILSPLTMTPTLARFTVTLSVSPAVSPRVAVRGGAVDVVNVEHVGIAADGSRLVRFVVEAERGDAPYDVTVIVDVGEEHTFAGPQVPPRSTGGTAAP
jgi:hypothetical protein